MGKITMAAADLERLAELLREAEAVFYKDGEDAAPNLVIPTIGITDPVWWPGQVVKVAFDDGFISIELDEA